MVISPFFRFPLELLQLVRNTKYFTFEFSLEKNKEKGKQKFERENQRRDLRKEKAEAVKNVTH